MSGVTLNVDDLQVGDRFLWAGQSVLVLAVSNDDPEQHLRCCGRQDVMVVRVHVTGRGPRELRYYADEIVRKLPT